MIVAILTVSIIGIFAALVIHARYKKVTIVLDRTKQIDGQAFWISGSRCGPCVTMTATGLGVQLLSCAKVKRVVGDRSECVTAAEVLQEWIGGQVQPMEPNRIIATMRHYKARRLGYV